MRHTMCFMFFLYAITHANLSSASSPLWTFQPLTETTISLPKNHVGEIKYQVTNESSRSHTLSMRSIPGVIQSTIGSANICTAPFTLGSHESCTLVLEIHPDQITSDHMLGGPIVCDHGNYLQCYTAPQNNQLNVTITEATYSLGGTISNLSGTVVLQNNTESPKAFNNNGPFTLTTDLKNGTAYHITVQSQPAGQVCSVTNPFGIVNDANIENVLVSCTATDYTVGGTVTGLSGAMILLNDYFDEALITTDGSFTFPTALPTGSPYDVIIAVQPSGQTCTVTNGQGMIENRNITNVIVSCPTLSTSLAHLALQTNGQARTITITNTAATTAENLSITYPAWPAGTVATSTCGSSLEPNTSCTITITPGEEATSNCNAAYTEAIPGIISISASNTPVSTTTSVTVLTYGCIYQKGFVYNINDTTPPSESIAGKTAALTNNSSSIRWNNGIDETTGANSWDFGSINTRTIIRAQGNGTYAAKTCTNYSIDSSGNSPCITSECYSNWYLPAICEMAAPEGSASCSPNTQNMTTYLPLLVSSDCSGSMCLSGNFWSSTEFSSAPLSVRYAWYEEFNSTGGQQTIYPKNMPFAVRCSRDLTF